MKRSHSLALAGFAAALASSTAAFAQVPLVGAQCRPAIANASQYQNCRVRIVAGSEVCRCEILPQALRRGGLDESNRGEFSRFDRIGANQGTGTLSTAGTAPSGTATGTMGMTRSGTATGSMGNTAQAGANVTVTAAQTSGTRAATGTQTTMTPRARATDSTEATAGTGMGNPGNGMTVGRAGENPNGRDFGAGTRGRSDVVRGDTATDMTDTAKAERKAERQAEKVERKAEKADMKEQARAERAAAKAERREMTEVEETTRDRAPRSGATAGTGTGNPGNGMMVGRAGENPNGKGFGEGTRGRSDVSRTTTVDTDSTGGTSGSLTRSELRSIVQELRRGTTINAILDRFDISRQELRQIAQENGIKNFGQARSEVNQIARDLRNGMSVSTILSRYGLTLEQLKEFAERNDLEDVLERISTATGSTAKSATKEADKAARGSKKSMDDDAMNDTMPGMGRSNRSGATAGTGTGNPGNGMNVGRAGENPNGKGFGDGTRGRSDVDTTGSTTGSTSDTSSGGSQGGGQSGGQGGGQGAGQGGGQGNGGQGSGDQGNGGGQGGGQGNGGGEGGRGK